MLLSSRRDGTGRPPPPLEFGLLSGAARSALSLLPSPSLPLFSSCANPLCLARVQLLAKLGKVMKQTKELRGTVVRCAFLRRSGRASCSNILPPLVHSPPILSIFCMEQLTPRAPDLAAPLLLLRERVPASLWQGGARAQPG